MMKSNIEILKDIPGYENRYKASNLGYIYSTFKNSHNPTGMKRMKPYHDKDGYLGISLSKKQAGERTQKTFRVHRLVALCFIDNKDNLPEVNHIDGNKENNNILNLEWISTEGNIKHSYKIGLHKTGEEAYQSKLTNAQVIWIRKNYIKGDKTYGARPLGRKFGVTKTCIKYIVDGRTYRDVK